MSKSAAALVVVSVVTALLGWRYFGLLSDFDELSTDHENLLSDWDGLVEDYDDLAERYNTSVEEYTSLMENYDVLVEDYETMYDTRYEEGYNAGYVEGVAEGAGTGYDIRDPTYREALGFIDSDRTNENEYNIETYTCVNFASDFKNNAFEAGFRCGYVIIEFPDKGHAIVCFETTDEGLIFIEPQMDDIVALTIGQPYFDRTKWQEPEDDDTVVRYVIAW